MKQIIKKLKDQNGKMETSGLDAFRPEIDKPAAERSRRNFLKKTALAV
jgi:hypothetical protein